MEKEVWEVKRGDGPLIIKISCLYNSNDYIRLFVTEQGGQFCISDDTEILTSIGADSDMAAIDEIVAKHGVVRDRLKLLVLCDPLDFSNKMTDLLDCIKEILALCNNPKP